MARWKLMAGHYLNIPGEEWEYKENDRTTGKERRMRIPVPTFLDPRDPDSWTNRWGFKDNMEGEVIVCHEGKGESTDKVFIGDPTPDMIPLDDEAKAISDSFEHAWSYKPETDLGTYSQSLVDKFQIEMAQKASAPVEIPGLKDLVEILAVQAKQNQEILASITRRV